ncbi:hypothetical protein FHG87_021091 [Trinorchestia longiramus]|nr:hypothetical protein FHG87_021091 [Trinorchestia longiramus]
MESNQNTEKATKTKTRYCKECKASYSLQLFNIRGCNMDECRFCYYKQESAAIIEKQSRTIEGWNYFPVINLSLHLHPEDPPFGKIPCMLKNEELPYLHILACTNKS